MVYDRYDMLGYETICTTTIVSPVVPIAPLNACEIAWRRCVQPILDVCGVAPVVAIVPVFSTGTCCHYRGTTTRVLVYKNIMVLFAATVCFPSFVRLCWLLLCFYSLPWVRGQGGMIEPVLVHTSTCIQVL